MRVQDIVKRVVAGGKVEDDFVEAKAVWPPGPQKVARRIAGMANTAGGSPILWIIGLDEGGHQVADLGDTDIANWWSAVEAKFTDDVAPNMRTMTIGTDHGAVVCLHFDTDRAPYVVSTDSTGGITREIPWRRLTSRV